MVMLWFVNLSRILAIYPADGFIALILVASVSNLRSSSGLLLLLLISISRSSPCHGKCLRVLVAKYAQCNPPLLRSPKTGHI